MISIEDHFDPSFNRKTNLFIEIRTNLFISLIKLFIKRKDLGELY